jgi:hypothetical protein
MTIEEYKEWIATRDPDPANWDYDKCQNADKLIKIVTIKNLELYLYQNFILGDTFRKWIVDMATYTYGSVETDTMLQDFKCYPEWAIIT